MSDHHRKLMKSLGGELAALIRSQASREPGERAAGARRWEELREESSRPASDGFREDVGGVLRQAVERLEQLQAELEPRDSDPEIRSR
jgi:hypothetical protein